MEQKKKSSSKKRKDSKVAFIFILLVVVCVIIGYILAINSTLSNILDDMVSGETSAQQIEDNSEVEDNNNNNNNNSVIVIEDNNNTQPDEPDEPEPEPEPEPEENEDEEDRYPKILSKLYYKNSNGGLSFEEREVSIVDMAQIKCTVQDILTPPSASNLILTIPEGTTLNGVNYKDEVYIFDFSNKLNELTGENRDYSIASIVATATSIEGVNKVKILCNGYSYLNSAEEEYGVLERDWILNVDPDFK